MTDTQQLYHYRITQAEETLAEAGQMLEAGMSPRSVTNRAYYSAFYMLLALFLASGQKLSTSKHTGVIGLFDVAYVKTGIIEKEYSVILHRLFDRRLELDYKEFVDVSVDDARQNVDSARRFVERLKKTIVSITPELATV